MRSVLVLAVTVTLLVLNATGPRRVPTLHSPKSRPHRTLGTAEDYPALARFLRAQSGAQATSLVSTR